MFTTYNATPIKIITRLNTDGSLDNTFQTGNGFGTMTGGPYVESFAVQQDGQILVGGKFLAYNDTVRSYILRINGDGHLNTGSVQMPATCIEDAIDVPFSINAVFNSGNIFSAQLSDSAGSFNSL